MGSFWFEATLAQNVGMIHHQKSLGKIDLGRRRKCEAIRNGWQVATRDAAHEGARPSAAQQ